MDKKLVRPKRPGDSADRVYEGLRRVIVGQTLAAGARLPEDAIATRFGVSRTVVRIAISRLVTDGLVERQYNRVARVASPTQAEAEDIFAMRRVIESLVVSRLNGAVSRENVETLRAHVRREEILEQTDRLAAALLSGEFHTLLAGMTGSKLLERYVKDLVARSSIVLTTRSAVHPLSCSAAEHVAIIDAMIKKDADAAKKEMTDHLQKVEDRARLLPGPAHRFEDLADALLKPSS